MRKAVLYIHGKGGNAGEAVHYQPLLPDWDVIGLDYQAQTPWEAKEEFPELFRGLCQGYDSVNVIANSIGAFFTMSALADQKIQRAYFISPVVNMEKLILDMMSWANVTEEELRTRKEIETAFGETLSWEYLCYVREHPIAWTVPTHILYGDKDNLTTLETVSAFARQTGATLTVMKDGEHWFHTPEQMAFLDEWIKEHRGNAWDDVKLTKK